MLQYLNPLQWARWFFELIYAWTLSIPWRDVPKAIPAIILLVVLFVTAVIASTDTSDWHVQLMNRQFAVAWEQDDFETAELVVMRQLRMRPNDSELIVRLAISRDEQGKHDNAVKLMRDLVAFKQDQAAARWLLTELYIVEKWDTNDEQQRSEFGQLLKLINKESPEDMTITQLYIGYLLASEKLAQAVPLLDKLSRQQPMRGLQAATISRQLGNDDVADQFALRSLAAVSKMHAEEPRNAVLAIAVAKIQIFMKRHKAAIGTLDQAVRRARTDENRALLKQAIGDAIVAWVAFIEESPDQTVGDRLQVLKMLQTAVQYAPNNPRVLMLVADQVLSSAGEDDSDIQSVRAALIEGSSPGIAHFIQGTTALMNDDVEQATMHLKMASELMPNSGAILNNLAVALTSRDDTDLEQSLKLSESAIKLSPTPRPHFFETRGQILFRMKRYAEAVPDLERALAVPELATNAHKALAACYAELGDKELSQQHLDAAKPDMKP